MLQFLLWIFVHWGRQPGWRAPPTSLDSSPSTPASTWFQRQCRYWCVGRGCWRVWWSSWRYGSPVPPCLLSSRSWVQTAPLDRVLYDCTWRCSKGSSTVDACTREYASLGRQRWSWYSDGFHTLCARTRPVYACCSLLSAWSDVKTGHHRQVGPIEI